MNKRYRFPRGFFSLTSTLVLVMTSFTLIQSLFVGYCQSVLSMSLNTIDDLNHTFTLIIYITPMITGFIAGRLLGFLFSILLALLFTIAGLYFLCFQPMIDFYSGLALIAVGNSIAAACLYITISKLLAKTPNRRQPGFTITYSWMNLGAAIAILMSHRLVLIWGYQGTFLIDAIFYLTSLFIFLMCGRDLYAVCLETTIANRHGLHRLLGVMVFCVLVPVAMYLLQSRHNTLLVLCACAISVAVFIFAKLTTRQSTDSRHVTQFGLLTLFGILFWILYALEPSQLMHFTEQYVSHRIMNVTLTTDHFTAINPLLVALLGLPLARIWLLLDQYKYMPQPPFKFAVGLGGMGVGYLIIASSTYFTQMNDNAIPLFWIVLAYVPLVIGELFVSPTGLAMIGQLSTKQNEPLLMGLWLFTNGLGASILQQWQLHQSQSSATLHAFNASFVSAALIALISATLLALLAPMLWRTNR